MNPPPNYADLIASLGLVASSSGSTQAAVTVLTAYDPTTATGNAPTLTLGDLLVIGNITVQAATAYRAGRVAAAQLVDTIAAAIQLCRDQPLRVYNPPTPRQPTPDEIADHYARFAGNLIGELPA